MGGMTPLTNYGHLICRHLFITLCLFQIAFMKKKFFAWSHCTILNNAVLSFTQLICCSLSCFFFSKKIYPYHLHTKFLCNISIFYQQINFHISFCKTFYFVNIFLVDRFTHISSYFILLCGFYKEISTLTTINIF